VSGVNGAGSGAGLRAISKQKQAGRLDRSACFLINRAACPSGRSQATRAVRAQQAYLRRATFFVPLFLCDLRAPVRDFVDFFTLCFFVVFFDL
jgi:hypothetical protein